MKHFYLSIILVTLAAFSSQAVEPADSVTSGRQTIAEQLVASGRASIVIPAKLNERLRPMTSSTESDESSAAESVKVSTGGYRIQAFSGNNARQSQAEAQNRASLIAAAFPEHETYVSFDAPYWRLKVGDFKTYEEASAALSILKSHFPAYAREMRLVRDRIKSVQ